ncbi:MFS transporter [Actinoplanes ianthinogenes]|uniref:MFS transporter n=1 Tax=Actinoplanes ianthinogenes TaxID=122358 RepID=A0ABM7LKU8_9ACTN|nr:MFS transporter [Actinoplanes ianthinogenes]BCJ39897.1 MFS transporter [Actinoplanes ianthinogenes]GGR08852.1 MFS transporter [Actinoplanes ianthinogenes]
MILSAERLVGRSPVERALTLSIAASSLAKGVLFGVSALFFTTVIGLSPATVGVGLTVAGGAGMAAAFGSGYLADRVGAQRVLVAATVTQSVALAAYCSAASAITFTLIACAAIGAQGAQRTAQATLLALHFTGPDRVTVRARLRVVTNVFVGLGSALATAALATGTPAAYVVAMLTASALVLTSTLPLRGFPSPPPSPSTSAGIASRAGGPRRAARSPLRDFRYVGIAAFYGLLTVQFGLLTVGMPLWVTLHTRAPATVVALLLVLNTVLVALFQLPAARLVTDVRAAGRTVLASSGFLVLTCLFYAGAAPLPALAAVGLLLLAVVAASAAEVLSEAGEWSLAFELADSRNPGAYQGISQTGFAAGTMLAPVVVTLTAIAHGTSGWLLLAGMFLTAGVATDRLARYSPLRAAGEADGAGRGGRVDVGSVLADGDDAGAGQCGGHLARRDHQVTP